MLTCFVAGLVPILFMKMVTNWYRRTWVWNAKRGGVWQRISETDIAAATIGNGLGIEMGFHHRARKRT